MSEEDQIQLLMPSFTELPADPIEREKVLQREITILLEENLELKKAVIKTDATELIRDLMMLTRPNLQITQEIRDKMGSLRTRSWTYRAAIRKLRDIWKLPT